MTASGNMDFSVGANAAVRRWQAPVVRQSGAEQRDRRDAAERLAEIETEAREAGYRRGFAAGEQQGLAQRAAEAGRLAALLDGLTPQVGVLDDQLLAQLGALVVVAVRQFVRRELSLQPGEVVRVIREAIATLPAAESRVTLHLHPDDAALVKDALHPELPERPWRVVEDLTLSRGGVRLETDTSRVDATVETRLNALIARLLGDERGTAGDD